MTSGPERSDAGFGDALEDFDVAEFKPKPRSPSPPRPSREETTAATNAAGFHSREPRSHVPQKQGRPQTGRNVPLSLKISADTRELMDAALEKVNEGQRVRIPLGEVIHQAFVAYAREIGVDVRQSDR